MVSKPAPVMPCNVVVGITLSGGGSALTVAWRIVDGTRLPELLGELISDLTLDRAENG
jgi:hypothetical protein